MGSYGDQVVVLRGHLEELQQALDSATSFHVADDQARRFKNVGGAWQPSHLTVRLENALDRVEGYLEEVPDELSTE